MHARLVWHVHTICPFLHNLAPILARSCKKCARNAGNYSCSNSCKILHQFLQDMCKIVQESCKKCARKGTYRVHVQSKSCMPDSCTILHDLASSFLLGWPLNCGVIITASKRWGLLSRNQMAAKTVNFLAGRPTAEHQDHHLLHCARQRSPSLSVKQLLPCYVAKSLRPQTSSYERKSCPLFISGCGSYLLFPLPIYVCVVTTVDSEIHCYSASCSYFR